MLAFSLLQNFLSKYFQYRIYKCIHVFKSAAPVFRKYWIISRAEFFFLFYVLFFFLYIVKKFVLSQPEKNQTNIVLESPEA